MGQYIIDSNRLKHSTGERRYVKSPIKTISLPEETYNALKAQAEEANRTISGQVKYLLRQSQNGEE